MSAERTAPGLPLRADGLTAGYGGDPVIRNVTVRADPGEVVSLVGANGSGKSTLLKALVGVIRVSSGTVTIGETDVTGRPPEEIARAGVGYVPQVDDVFAPLTVRENLEMGGYLLPARQVRTRIDAVAEVFPRLAAMLPRPAGKLSGGERKMLAMGRVLMLQPAVFLLDEPTANLAPPSPARCSTSTSGSSRGTGRRSWSSSSALAPCSRSPTGPTSSPAARSGWRAPRPSSPRVPPSSNRFSAAR